VTQQNQTLAAKIQKGLGGYKYWLRAAILIKEAAPKWTVIWAVLIVLQGVLPTLSIYFSKLVIDSIISAKNSGGSWAFVSEVIVFIAILGVVLLLTEALQYVNDWVRMAQAENVTDHIKDQIHRKAAEVDYSFYESSDYHNLMEQAKGESSSKPLALLENVGSIAQSTITLLTMAAILVSYGWWLPIALFCGTFPALFVALRSDRIYHKWWKTTVDDRRWLAYFDVMLTNGDAAAEMRLFNLSKSFREKFQNLRKRLRREKIVNLRRQSVGKIVASLIALLTLGGAMGWMTFRVLYGVATLGDLAVFYQVFTRGQVVMRAVLGSISQSINNTLYLETLFEFFDLKSKMLNSKHPIFPPRNFQAGIRFNNVSFSYPESSKTVIKDFTLHIPSGKIVSLVGVNGAGKSTLIKLLSRFYDPSAGSIEIDGVDIREFEINEYRRLISVLFQFQMQYHASANENIALGNTNAELRKAETKVAARRAGADKFISNLPQQYDTLLGKWFVNGQELSGGEWQRVALARAYYRQAPIIVLDEPTSYMDSWSESDWFDRFREVAHGKTSLIITHRFTIAMRADIIHVVDDGRIIESGSHHELVESQGFYAQSWEAQMKVVKEKQHDLGLSAV
jgi:ATP-binding cassette subfamily B protein